MTDRIEMLLFQYHKMLYQAFTVAQCFGDSLALRICKAASFVYTYTYQ